MKVKFYYKDEMLGAAELDHFRCVPHTERIDELRYSPDGEIAIRFIDRPKRLWISGGEYYVAHKGGTMSTMRQWGDTIYPPMEFPPLKEPRTIQLDGKWYKLVEVKDD